MPGVTQGLYGMPGGHGAYMACPKNDQMFEKEWDGYGYCVKHIRHVVCVLGTSWARMMGVNEI